MRIAIIGCGALARVFYLPVLKKMGKKPAVLVDPNTAFAQKLADQYEVESVAADAKDIVNHIDAAIISSPNFLHVTQALSFLQKGKHVLLEKPMAANAEDASLLIQTARQQGVCLQVGMMRRFWKLNKAVKAALESNLLGKLQLISMREGTVMDWPAESFAVFSTQQSLGGVCIDTGSHTIDLLCWWANAAVRNLHYKDDNKGGVEADCRLDVEFDNEVKGIVELSRIRKMPNEFLLQGTEGWIKMKPYNNVFEASSKKIENEIYNLYNPKELKAQSFNDLFEEQLTTWITAIQNKTAAAVTAESVLPSIALIEQSYKNRQQLVYPFNV